MNESFQRVDKDQLARRFSAAAKRYDAHAQFQQQVGQQLLAQLANGQQGRATANVGLDLGCGSGFFLPSLAPLCLQLLGADLAHGMLMASTKRLDKTQLLCADAEYLPLSDQSVDWIFSNLMVQWCERPDRALVECARVLTAGGQLLMSILLDGSLWQLKQAWQKVDDGVHVNRFVAATHFIPWLAQAGLGLLQWDCQAWTVYYPDVRSLLGDLKGIGANQLNDDGVTAKAKGLAGRGRIAALAQAYEPYRMAQGLPLTYQVGVIAAQKAWPSKP